MAKNHAADNADLAIFDIVKTRLPMLVDSPANQDTLSIFTLELMHELEPYFQVGAKQVPETDPITNYEVGDEAGYTVAQKSLIADLVAIQSLAIIATGGSIGAEGEAAPTGGATYMKLAKAGSVQVEFAQPEGGKDSASMVLGSTALMSRLKASAIRKGHNMGLIIDINADSEIAIDIARNPPINFPFIMGNPFNC